MSIQDQIKTLYENKPFKEPSTVLEFTTARNIDKTIKFSYRGELFDFIFIDVHYLNRIGLGSLLIKDNVVLIPPTIKEISKILSEELKIVSNNLIIEEVCSCPNMDFEIERLECVIAALKKMCEVKQNA